MNRQAKLSYAIRYLNNVVSKYYPGRVIIINTPKFIITIERHEGELAGRHANAIILDELDSNIIGR